MSDSIDSFIKLVKHPFKFRMFLLTRLPSAFLCGVRVRAIDRQRCMVTVPYKWLTQNPFRSTYFACLSMAAEMSTGALAMAYTYQRKPAISLLVVKVESEYFKKATGRTNFTCGDGDLIREAIEQSIETGDAKVVRARSVGNNEKDELVAEFFITWSFKARQEKT